MEQLFLMHEIENFYSLSAFLMPGLEHWLINHQKQNALDIMEWSPKDSKVNLK